MSTIHRFYVGDKKDKNGPLVLSTELWLNDPQLVSQIVRVLRMRIGEELVLFDGGGKEVLYEVADIEPESIKLNKITDMIVSLPPKKVTLAWSMLKKDKNEWVLQKATEIGVSHFVPIISARVEKTGFDKDRLMKIIVEAAEQCGRHDIPTLSDPILLENYINQHIESSQIFVADMNGQKLPELDLDHCILLVGPEGGWTEQERHKFLDEKIPSISVGNFTLRAETACIIASQAAL